ncbi:hypothetical protein MKX01_039079 [Papaver californicum]|nr:hypothetical protein MKX01_039079 [Papaver californicum]
MCNAIDDSVLIGSGWHYLTCPRYSKKVLGDDGDLWCTKFESKVEMPFLHLTNASVYGYFFHHMLILRFEVEDHTGTTVFVALDSEVQKLVCQAAAKLIGASETVDYPPTKKAPLDEKSIQIEDAETN